jgi:hypothetical protein
MRHPATPDCGIRGCTRSEYRAGLCRQHYDLLPLDARIRRAADWMIQAHLAAKASREHAIGEVQAMLDQEAPPSSTP